MDNKKNESPRVELPRIETAPIKNFAEAAIGEYEKGIERLIEQTAAQTAEAFRTVRAFNGTVLSAVRASVDSTVAATAALQSAAEAAFKNVTRVA